MSKIHEIEMPTVEKLKDLPVNPIEGDMAKISTLGTFVYYSQGAWHPLLIEEPIDVKKSRFKKVFENFRNMFCLINFYA